MGRGKHISQGICAIYSSITVFIMKQLSVDQMLRCLAQSNNLIAANFNSLHRQLDSTVRNYIGQLDIPHTAFKRFVLHKLRNTMPSNIVINGIVMFCNTILAIAIGSTHQTPLDFMTCVSGNF